MSAAGPMYRSECAQYLESSRVVHALDDRREDERRHRPAQPSTDRQPMDSPVLDTFGMTLMSGQQDVEVQTEAGEARQELALVGFPTRGRLWIDAAMGRADSHGASGHRATSSTYGLTRSRR